MSLRLELISPLYYKLDLGALRVLNRAIDAVLGISVAVSLKYLAKSVDDVLKLGPKVTNTVVEVLVERITVMHTNWLRDPCYFEMTTEERWVVLTPYFDQLFKAATLKLSVKRVELTRKIAHSKVNEIIYSKGV